MGNKNKIKSKEFITMDEIPDALQRFSEMIEKGEIEIRGTALKLEDITSLKFGIEYKKYKGTVEAKLSVEPEIAVAVTGSEAPGGEKPSYKHLKKSMNSKFKIIRNTVNEGTVPDLTIVENFYRECEIMVSYSGKGDEYYEDFMDAADDLLLAVRDGDIEGVSTAVDSLRSRESECHDMYK